MNKDKKNIIVINGPNLNMLGKRDAQHYGSESLEEINDWLKNEFSNDVTLSFYQSNIEGEIINKIQHSEANYSGIVLNAGAFTHYAIGIRDAIDSITIRVIEVHLSNISNREEFRQKSVISPVCAGQISGLGKFSYFLAVKALLLTD